MEESNIISSNKIALKWGLIFAVLTTISIVFQSLGILAFIGFFACIIMAQNSYKKSNRGFMSYGKGIGIATIVILIGVFFQSIVTFFHFSNNGSKFDEIKNKQLELFEDLYSDDQLEKMESLMDSFLTPSFMSISAFFGNLIMFFILALIVTAFTKKQDPELI